MVATHRQGGEDQKPDAGGRRGHHQQGPHPETSDHAGPEQGSHKADHPLRCDHQAGFQRRVVQRLLQVDRKDHQFSGIPGTKEKCEDASCPQSSLPEQTQFDERFSVRALHGDETNERYDRDGQGRPWRRTSPEHGCAEAQALGFGGDSVQWVVTAYAIRRQDCLCDRSE